MVDMDYRYLDFLQSNVFFVDVIEVFDVKTINNIKVYKTFDFKYKDLTITIGFTRKFPFDIPYYKVRSSISNLLPHIDETGYICTQNIYDVDHDVNDIQTIIDNSATIVRNILEMNEEERIIEFRREYSDYISRNVNSNRRLHNQLSRGGVEKDILFLDDDDFDHNQITELYVSEYDNFDLITKLGKSKIGLFKKSDPVVKKILYVPLIDFPRLPEYNKPLLLECIIEQTSGEIQKKIQYRDYVNREEYIFSYPYNDSYRYFFAKIDTKKDDKGRYLVYNKDSLVYPNRVRLISPSFLRQRGGSNTYSNNILMIGVGSLGSEILSLLCKSGFTRITLVDHDNFTVYNSFRHICGVNYSFYTKENNSFEYKEPSKVDILKWDMENKYPGVTITCFNKDIQDAVNLKLINLTNYDYIITSTGNTLMEKWLTRYIYNNKIKTQLFITWLEAYGLGRHIFMCDGMNPGCFECLLKSSKYVHFTESNVDYKEYEDTCIGSYSKYGAADISMLAGEVVKKILFLESGGEFINRHISIKGDASLFLSKGHKVTEYYSLSQGEIDKLEQDFIYEGCDCCGR